MNRRIPDDQLIALAVKAGMAASAARTSGRPADAPQRTVAEPAAASSSVDAQIAEAMAVRARVTAALSEAAQHFAPDTITSWVAAAFAPPTKPEGTP